MALNCVLVQYVQLKAYFHMWHGTWWSKYMWYRKCSISLCLPVLQVSKCGHHWVPRIGAFQWGALHLLKGKCHHQDHLNILTHLGVKLDHQVGVLNTDTATWPSGSFLSSPDHLDHAHHHLIIWIILILT